MSLSVKPISAFLSRDTQIFSNMDPYVVVIVGTEKQKTRTHQQGGKRPRWTDELIFRSKASSMLITVYDEDTLSDDVVGSANVQLRKYIENPIEHQQNVGLSYKGKSSGTLKLLIKYTPLTSPGHSWPSPNTNYNTHITNNNNNNNNINQPYFFNPTALVQPQTNNQWGAPTPSVPVPSNNDWGSQTSLNNPNNNSNGGWGPQPQNNGSNTGWGQQFNQQAINLINTSQKGIITPPPFQNQTFSQNGVWQNIMQMGIQQQQSQTQVNPYGTMTTSTHNNGGSGWGSGQNIGWGQQPPANGTGGWGTGQNGGWGQQPSSNGGWGSQNGGGWGSQGNIYRK